MPRTVFIEVAAAQDASSTAKGRLLEKFAGRLLETQNFAIAEEVRLTGTEVDLLAVENSTGERVFVECKAHRSTISADVITKLYGNVMLKNFSELLQAVRSCQDKQQLLKQYCDVIE